MTDRELLEMAAKAVGREINLSINRTDGLFSSHVKGEGFSWWNPLINSEDAFRLMVDLDLHWPTDNHFTDELDLCADKHAATRRAIVLAAAEIGRGME